MKLYSDNGYLNIEAVLNIDVPFIFVVGGRGTGKTFGALKYVVDNDKRFMFMRRTQSQLDLINKPEFSPFKPLNSAYKWDITSESITKYNAGFYHSHETDNGRIEAVGAPLGYSCALSTVSNLRGFDASDIELLIYDEFIPEKHERPIKNEGPALLNAYETMNRNRELEGKKPLKLLCLANANDLGNPIFMELNLIGKAENMRRKEQELSIDYTRGIALIILTKSPISDAKASTALYKLAAGSEYSDMALANTFAELKTDNIKSMPLSEYKAIVTVGEITIYKHKANKTYYVSTHCTGSPESFTTSDIDLKRFYRKYSYVLDSYMNNKVYFENSMCEILLTKYVI